MAGSCWTTRGPREALAALDLQDGRGSEGECRRRPGGTGAGGPHTWQHGEEGAAEAVAHGVGTQADVHARIVLACTGDEQLVEVGAVGPRPYVTRGQHHKLLPTHVDSGVVAALSAVLHTLQPLDHRLHIAAHFALEGCRTPEIHRGVHGVCAREHRLGARPLCGDTMCGRGPQGTRQPPAPARHSRITSTL